MSLHLKTKTALGLVKHNQWRNLTCVIKHYIPCHVVRLWRYVAWKMLVLSCRNIKICWNTYFYPLFLYERNFYFKMMETLTSMELRYVFSYIFMKVDLWSFLTFCLNLFTKMGHTYLRGTWLYFFPCFEEVYSIKV